MSYEKNMEELITRLRSLGFPPGLEAGLCAHICFGLKVFTLHYRCLRDGDVLQVCLPFQKAEEGTGYSCPYYDASLRRQVEIPPAFFGEVDIAELEVRMKDVDWSSALPSRFSDETSSARADPFWERKAAIEGILADLGRLGETPEGQALALRLKLKYWADTPLEGFIPNLAAQKSTLEVGQRFYFFEEEAGISLDEAYRFLCHRWREKQWMAQKKSSVAADAIIGPEGKSRAGGGKVGPKKRPPKGSKLKI